ncbi:hypothetical protein [Sphingomonas sp.]|uniref:hypothetical protein n=2 Tax=unclassified Sphingomonas TaxID=196159 RepID=UPI0028A0F8E8|nr:hypothetical protein [Sphingomonas sp.]
MDRSTPEPACNELNSDWAAVLVAFCVALPGFDDDAVLLVDVGVGDDVLEEMVVIDDTPARA